MYKQGRKGTLDTPERKIKHTVMTEAHWERENITRKGYVYYDTKGGQEKVTRKLDKKRLPSILWHKSE